MKPDFVVTAALLALVAAGAALVLWWSWPGPVDTVMVTPQSAPPPPVAAPEPQAAAAQPPAAATPPEPVSTLVLFAFDRAELTAAEAGKLDRLLAHLDLKTIRFEAVGHADRIGAAAYNRVLSQRRADAVKAYLVKSKRMPPEAVRTLAKGESEPASGDACVDMGPELRRNVELVECLQPDRRVEVTAVGAI